jgi:prepilin-type N-terminal cleavage/methylation domain-containing protein
MPGRKSNGFSLIELSLVLVILTALLAGGIALTIALIDRAAYETTKERMDAIQKALHDYVLAFGVLPCPADITAAPDSAAYGVGTGTSASCTPSCSAANFTSGETVAGMVPVKTLRLMDKYAVDGWGSRILYAVDRRLTTGGGLAQYEDYPAIGSITVRDDAGGDRTTHAVYVLASHGSNKHGGFPITGGSLRRPSGSTNADELENCDCDATGTSTAFNATFVQRFPVSDPAQTSDRFDDIVRYGNYGDFGADRYGTVACACPLP